MSTIKALSHGLAKRKGKLLIALVFMVGVVVLGGLSHYGCRKKVHEADIAQPKVSEALGEAQIIVYEKGKKITLDSNSPYLKELQGACEQMLTSAKTFVTEITILPDPEEAKNKEWLIQLTYPKPIMVTIPRLAGTTDVGVGGLRLLIPLTGKLTYLESVLKDREKQNKYTYLFLLPTEMGFPSEIIGGEAELVGTKKDVRKIKDILAQLKIQVP